MRVWAYYQNVGTHSQEAYSFPLGDLTSADEDASFSGKIQENGVKESIE